MTPRRHGIASVLTRSWRGPVFLIATACAVLLVVTPTAGNLWDIVTGAGFEIPAESSIFTFRVTRMNDGSGEWWLYGEDGRFFYGLPDDGPYVAYPRDRAARCPEFDPQNIRTWCGTASRVQQ